MVIMGLLGGIAIRADVVRAEGKVAEATRDLARAHHEQVLARLRRLADGINRMLDGIEHRAGDR